MNIAANREHAWPLSADILPYANNEGLDKNFIPLESNGDSYEFTDQLEFDKGIENFEKLVDKRNVEIRKITDKRVKKVKKVGLGVAKVGGDTKLSKHIDCLINVVEDKKNDTVSCSTLEVMQMVESLPGVEVGSDLWLFTTLLFLSKENREMFSVTKDTETMLKGLYFEKSPTYNL